jgi:hypothetical protein
LKKKFAAIGLIAGLTMIGIAHADVGVTGQVGTTGASFHVDVPVRSHLSARFGTGYIDYSYSDNIASLNYDLKRKLRTVEALVDWYPFNDSVFRLSGGLVYNINRIDAFAKSNQAGNYTIQGNTYSPASAGRIEGKIDYPKVAPYLGIGWGKADKKKGWSFSVDVGMLRQGSPNTSLTSTGCMSPTAMCTQLASDLAKENAALANETRKYKAYPVLRVGLRYQF